MKDNKKYYLPTSGKVKVYTFLDGTKHILYNEEWYDIKIIKDLKIINQPTMKESKSKEQINLSKSHKPNTSPWKKGLPPVVSHQSMYYALTHGC